MVIKSAEAQLTITDLNDISIKSQINLYCRASVSTGSAEEGPDITKIDGYDSADLTKELWSSEIPSATSEFPYVWVKQIIEYDGDIPTFITYTLFTTSDSIEIDSANLIGSALATNIFPIVQDNSDNPKVIDKNALYPIQLNKIRGWSKQEEGTPSFKNPKSIENIDSIELVGWNEDGTNLVINLKGNILCSLPNEIYDELIIKNDKFVLVKRVGFIDLGTLTWQKNNQSMCFVAEIPSAKDVGYERNAVGYCSHYELSTEAGPNKDAAFLYQKLIFIYDSTKINSVSAADFKTAMTGVTFLYELAKPMEIELEQSNLYELLFKDHNEVYFKDKFTTLKTSSSLNPFSISYKIPIVTTDVSDNSIKNLLSTEERDITLYSTAEEEKLLLHGKYKINSDNSYFNILLIEWDKNDSDGTFSSTNIFNSENHEHTVNEWYNINEIIKFLNNSNIANTNLVLRFSGSISLKELKLEKSTSPTEWNDSLQEKVEHLENQLKVASAAIGLTSIDLSTISANEGNINYGIEDKNGHKVLVTRFLATEALQTDAIRSSNLSTYTDKSGILRVQTNDDDLDENFKGKFSKEGSFFDLSDGQIYSKNFRIDNGGNVTLRGNVTANSGLIGGFKVADGKLETTYLDNTSAGIKGSVSENDNKIFWAGVTKTQSTDDNGNSITINSEPTFSVDVSGKVVATSGSLGGITINDTGIHSSTVDINSDGSFNIGNKLMFNGKTLSLNDLSLSLNLFDKDVQNQILKTKYITVNNDGITFAKVEKVVEDGEEKEIFASGSVTISSDGLKLSDKNNIDKINISSNGVLIGSSDNGINITDNNIKIKQKNQDDSTEINISNTSIDFKNNKGIEIMSLSTNENNPNIILGNKEVPSSVYMELSSSNFTLGRTNSAGQNSQLFTISENGFILNEKTIPVNNNKYFIVGDNFCYDSTRGLAIAENAFDLLWPKKNNNWVTTDNWLKEDVSGTTKIAWEKDSNKFENTNAVNILKTEHGIGFFSGISVDDPIAYFSNNKFYVKRTQVVTEQEISGFKWFVRSGSDYVTENGKILHNLGLKWVG